MLKEKISFIDQLVSVNDTLLSSKTWSSQSSYKIYVAEDENWIVQQHPFRHDDEHVVFYDGKTDIYRKNPDGPNELFYEPFLNRLSYTLGANVTPTFIIKFKENFGIGSVGTLSTLLSPNLWNSFKSWSGSSFLAEHFVFNIWFCHNDWKKDVKFENYAITLSNSNTIKNAYEFDRSHVLFDFPKTFQRDESLLNGGFREKEIEYLINTNFTGQCFFGYEIFFNNPERIIKAIRKVEAMKDNFIYRTSMSVARLLGKIEPQLKDYYNKLAAASSKVLVARKKKIRKILRELFILNPQFITPSLRVELAI